MTLFAIIILVGVMPYSIWWATNYYYMNKYKPLLKNPEEELSREFKKGILLYLVIAVLIAVIWRQYNLYFCDR